MFYSAHQQMALLPFIAGLLGVYAECLRPGMILPGVIGSTLVVLAFPADWRVAALFAAGLALLALEWVLAMRGILLTAGLATLAACGFVWSGSARVAAVAVLFGLLSSALFRLAVRARRNKLEGKLRS